jgi:hypothetical protein
MPYPFLYDIHLSYKNSKFIVEAHIFTIQDKVCNINLIFMFMNICSLHMVSTSDHFTWFPRVRLYILFFFDAPGVCFHLIQTSMYDEFINTYSSMIPLFTTIHNTILGNSLLLDSVPQETHPVKCLQEEYMP